MSKIIYVLIAILIYMIINPELFTEQYLKR